MNRAIKLSSYQRILIRFEQMYFDLNCLLLGVCFLQLSKCFGDREYVRKLLQLEFQYDDIVSINDYIEKCELVINNPVCKEENVSGTIQLETMHVISGEDTDVGRWPYMLSLQSVDESKNNSICRRHFCGATLIAPSIALTSAHCVWGSHLRDKRSPFEREQIDALTITGPLSEDIFVSLAPQCRHFHGKQDRKAVQYYHPSFFSPAHLKGDIAILVVDAPFVNASYVKYKAPDQNCQINVSETWLTTIGWGSVSSYETESMNMSAVESLQQGNVQYLDSSSCMSVLNDTNVADFLVPGIMFCAQNDEVDACLGDSGGPLLLAHHNGEAYGDPHLDIQVGIVSWGTIRSCSSAISQQDPGIYTHIQPFISWIDSIIQMHQNQLQSPVQERDNILQKEQSPLSEIFQVQDTYNPKTDASVKGKTGELLQLIDLATEQTQQFDNYDNLLL
eukprot:TRINITY_DN398_c0_g3_i2.p1 TRINITY_DN398_c0_g3~~TRINITY_DN398_c0_g3_i2.p1  ORF type:complete len:448 (-),score=49.15 TRINITY_DN398_c0_g3_i2:3005-4348(-)